MHTLLFIDSRVDDTDLLIGDLPEHARVVMLHPGEDGVMQMVRALAGVRGLAALHVVSHGAEASLALGNALLDAHSLARYEAALVAIGMSLADGGDLLLYGCEVARGPAGQAFVGRIAQLTGAQVAAATGKTGHPALGGDWALAWRTGPVAAHGFPAAAAQAAWHHVLAAPNPLDLSSLNGTTGFKVSGVAAGDRAGMSVSDAGDVNGDGFADLIIGGYRADNGSLADAGASYVVFGKAAGFASNLNLSSLNGSTGFRLLGASAGENAGRAVSSAGDLNGDGFADLIVGAPGASPNSITGSGAAYVVFGAASFTSSLNLSALNGSSGFRLAGVGTSDSTGYSVSSAGDVNGDGFDDLIVGAFGVDLGASANYGASYVVFGKASGFASRFNLSALGGNDGFRIFGVQASDRAGFSVSGGGDINGDGFADLIVGANYASPSGVLKAGASYVVFGKATGFAANLDLTSLDGSNGFRLAGNTANDQSGVSVSHAGDVNGDGLDDLIVGAGQALGFAGGSHVVFGATSFASRLDLSTLNGVNGFRLSGVSTNDKAGASVSSAGDFNGDGYADLIVGGPFSGITYAGAAYVVYGKAAGFASNIALAALTGSDGFQLTGVAQDDTAGSAVSGAGDVNGDGFDDLIVSAPRADPNSLDSGASYVVFGSSSGAVTHAGGTGNDTLTGTAAADVMVGGQGNDSLSGGGGADAFRGGAGNDVIVVPDTSFRLVDGGAGTDTLRLSGGGQSLALTRLADNRITGIEVIDITGSGNNTLALAAGDLLHLADTGNTLRVDANAGDLVVASGAWTVNGTTTLNARTYEVYKSGAATLQVDAAADVFIFSGQMQLSALDGSNGFMLNGVLSGDESGFSVSDAGDINGDGYGDLIIGAPVADVGGIADAGTAYVVFGAASGFATGLNLSALNGSNGFRLAGVTAQDNAGRSVSGAGDINGDGFADLIVGAPQADAGLNATDNGTAFVMFGKASGFASSLSLSGLSGSTGFQLTGGADLDNAGRSVHSAGDVNGDGFDDLIIGAYKANTPEGVADTGASYVVFGKATGFASTLNLATLNGANGFQLFGVGGGDQSGLSAASAGDFNGDGYDDLIIGARFADLNAISNSGAAYVVFGQASGFASRLDLSSLDGNNGLRLAGEVTQSRTGFSVGSAGDINGDGLDDIVVGAYGATGGGAAYVVFGAVSGLGANLNLSALDGVTGFRLQGAAAGNQTGMSVSSAGDVNADGYDDLIIGAQGADQNGSNSGASYVVFGKAAGFAASLALSALDGRDGFQLLGAAASDYAGRSVSGAGDVNGDGFDDLVVGAPSADPNAISAAGSSYVVFGGNFTGTVTQTGGSGADSLAGSAATDVLVGGQGNDTLTGNGGADVFNAGAGDDRIVVADLAFRQIDGGAGTDTLALAGSGVTLDLATFANHRISGIEVIDLTGSGNNTLRLRAADVPDLSGSSNTLRVDGNAGDVLMLPESWAAAGNTQIGNQAYRVFTQGAVTLQVDADVVIPFAGLSLSNLDGTNGFRLAGVTAGDRAGGSVSNAGDVNGDGFDDLIVGAIFVDAADGTRDIGASYVVFGKASGFASSLNLVSLDGGNGFQLFGVNAIDHSGNSTSSAGDLNGDGYDDLIIGAYQADLNELSNTGGGYVVFGRASGFTASFKLSALDGNNGFRLAGVGALDQAGNSVSNAGDVNGDGFGDLIIGATAVSLYAADSQTGATYVVFGRASGFTSNLNLSALDGSNGFRLAGTAAIDRAGNSVSNAGDLNGDGFDDLIVGARNANVNGINSGASYVVFGQASGFASSIALSTLNGTNGFRLADVAGATSELTGDSVSNAGDVNGDGFDDLIVGAPLVDVNGTDSGASYVVFGRASGFAANLNIAALDGTNGFRLAGVEAGDQAGDAVSTAGDVNGDGFDDLIIGAPGGSGTSDNAGVSYIVFGRASGFSANFELSALDGTNGFRLTGGTGILQAGRSVSDAGDVNGDGYDDLIVGAAASNPNGLNSGASYVVFGGNFSGAVTHAGSAGADSLAGGLAADVMVAGQGDDTLSGGGGADVFNAGSGNDRIVVADAGFKLVDGGTGTDTLALGGSGVTLDLTALANNRITGIEVIDLSGSGNNTLRLAEGDVLDLSDSSNTLRVDGNAGDMLVRQGIWMQGANTSINGQAYKVFTKGAATLQVSTAVSTTVIDPVIQLSALDGNNGFRLAGAAAYDSSGYSVSNAGDVNGDGFGDLLVGAHDADPHGTQSGASYLVFGRASGFGTGLDLSALDGSNGFRVAGVVAGDAAGFSVSNAGDVNGDGYGDLIVGAFQAGASAGASYVVFGGAASTFSPSLDLSTLNGANGFRLDGAGVSFRAGWSVSSTGDINGDGFDDLIIGSYSGKSHVIFGGPSSKFASSLALSAIDGSNGFRLASAAENDRAGYSVSNAGDLNGDGFDDLIVGAFGADVNGGDSGASYVVFGRAAGFGAEIDLGNLTDLDRPLPGGIRGVRVTGAAAGDQSGLMVSNAGDVNGDGYDDLIIGARQGGAAHVVFGRASGFGSNIDLASLNGGNGFRLAGADSRVSSAGDVNGDGFDDLIIGDVNGWDSHLVFGASAFAAVLELSALDGNNGFHLAGYSSSASGAGDVNGDGFDDLIIGNTGDSPNGLTFAGTSYVVFGGNFNGAVTHLGGSAADALTGTAAAETFVGGQGDDTLTGGGGADVFNAGAGNDRLVVADSGFRLADGGAGYDTLALAGSGLVLDLTTRTNNRISGIEAIDLTGTGNNVLRLTQADVLDLSEGSNTLRIAGNAGDVLVRNGFWAATGSTVIDNQAYAVYKLGLTTLQVSTAVTEVVELPVAGLDGDNGFRLSGGAQARRLGDAVAGAGDVNGDGYADMIFDRGSVVFGRATGFGADFNIATLDGGTGFRLVGPAGSNSPNGAGDFNGDGFDDLIVSGPFEAGAGSGYVVFGRSGGYAPTADLAALDGSNGFRIAGVAVSFASDLNVQGAGDVNGDGFADLIVGVPFADPHGSGSGAAYVVFGRAGMSGSNLNLSTLDGNNGFRLAGVAEYDYAGSAVSGAGDVNGDGFDDLIVGAPHPSGSNYGLNVGKSFVVFGRAGGFAASLDLSALDGNNGFRLTGAVGDQSGGAVSSAGDINGDGFGDLIVGAQYAGPLGASYVVFGRASGFGADLNVSALDGNNGFRVPGIATPGFSSNSVSSAGDVNGDGFDDLLIGARAADVNGAVRAGASYVVFGRAGGFAADLDLATLGRNSGFRVVGAVKDDRLGTSVSAAGDVNGDGFDDILVGAPLADPNDVFLSGASYVVFGADFSNAVTQRGTGGADALTGTANADVMLGGLGDDTLTGAAGNDLLNGGAGLDVAVFSGNRAAYTVTRNRATSGFTVTGPDGTDRLRDIEILRFADSSTLLASESSDAGIVERFSAFAYLASNPGLIGVFAADTTAATNHYLRFGHAEHRPVSGFDGYAYLASNPGLIGVFGSNADAAIEHYVRFGFAENRATASFDGLRYLASNPGLIGVFGTDAQAAVQHYVAFGFGEGRPTTSFNAYRYLDSNLGLLNFYGPDAAAATDHFLRFGYTEGRSTTAFDPYLYMASNPGLIAPLNRDADAASEHYARFGLTENRPTASFSVYQYLATNATLIPFFAGHVAEAVQHFVNFGYAEGRPANGFFGQLYLASNPTLIDSLAHTTVAETLETTATHFVQTGYAQGLRVEGFNPLQYLASNLGLLNVLGPDALAAINHFIDFGYHEGRATTSFDGLEYIASNPGLIPFFGTNADAGIAHFVFNGYAEGRPTTSFDAQQYHDNYGDLENRSLTDARVDFITGGFAQGRTDAPLPLSAGATAGADALTGSGADDTLSGGAGNDTLAGGLGNDTLTGGYGQDQFVFNTALNGTTNVDKVVDFTHGADKLVLENAVFTQLLNRGALDAGNFAANATGAAQDADDYVVYNSVTGDLYYDADGSGSGAAVAFATLASHPAITAADFLVI